MRLFARGLSAGESDGVSGHAAPAAETTPENLCVFNCSIREQRGGVPPLKSSLKRVKAYLVSPMRPHTVGSLRLVYDRILFEPAMLGAPAREGPECRYR
jgi:hypothetical protein